MRRAAVILWGLFAVLVLILAIGASGGKRPGLPHPFHATSRDVVAAVRWAISGSSTSPGLASAPTADCLHPGAGYTTRGSASINCDIQYTLKEATGIDADMELVQPTARLWKVLFSDRHFQHGFLTVSGPATTVGGKSETSEYFRLDCDRAAARQIDWNNVDGAGIRALCDYVPLLRGMPGYS